MQAAYGVFVRDKDGTLNQRVNDFIELHILDTMNDVGQWEMHSISADPCPFKKGNGIVIVRNNVYFYSGIVTQISDTMNARTSLHDWTVRGTNDLGLLSRRICYVDPETGSTTTTDHYRDTGILSDVIERLISKNIGVDALPERKEAIIEAYQGEPVGDTVSVELRFQNLLKAVIAVCTANICNIRPVWDEQNRKLYFQVFESRDLSQAIIFTEQLNNIVESEYIGRAPEGNWILAGGTGEMTERQFATAENVESINNWGRIEYFQDARNQHDIEENAEEVLQRKSDNVTGYSCVASDADNAPQYRIDYRLGDYVGMKIGEEYIIAQVQQVEINVSDGGEQISPKCGTVAIGQFREIFVQLDNLRQDVNELLGTEIE